MTFNIIISHIFSKNFIEFSQVVQKIWTIFLLLFLFLSNCPPPPTPPLKSLPSKSPALLGLMTILNFSTYFISSCTAWKKTLISPYLQLIFSANDHDSTSIPMLKMFSPLICKFSEPSFKWTINSFNFLKEQEKYFLLMYQENSIKVNI